MDAKGKQFVTGLLALLILNSCGNGSYCVKCKIGLYMKQIVIIVCLLCILSSCVHTHQQDPLVMDAKHKALSEKWKTDSLGIDSFRINQLFFDKDSRDWLIGGYNFIGFSREIIIKIFGEPNEKGFGKEDQCLMMFYIVHRRKNKPNTTLEFGFDKDNNVANITLCD